MTDNTIQHFKDCLSQDRGHCAMALNKGREALILRAHLLRTAESEILIQTFIWMNDECGRYFAYLLLQAAKRGVKVKVLVDTWPGVDFPALLVFLGSAHKNIEIKFYNPPGNQITPHPWFIFKSVFSNPYVLSHRMHSKAFIADGRMVIIGGRNYENDYYDMSEKRNFKDREIAISGPVAAQARSAFWRYWNASCSHAAEALTDYEDELRKCSLKASSPREDYGLNHRFDELENSCLSEEYINRCFTTRFRFVEQAEFFADEPGLNQPETSRTVSKLETLLLSAESELLLQSPYLALDSFLRRLFKRLAERESPVDIRFSTNSLASTDNVIAYGTSLYDRERHLKTVGLRIFEMRPLPDAWREMLDSSGLKIETKKPAHTGFHLCLHGKTYIVDDHTTCITSANIDPRSMHINTEEGVIVRDKAFTAEVKADIERDIAPGNSWAVGFPKKKERRSRFLGDVSFTWLRRGRPTACFELIQGGKVTSCFDREFYKNYRSVGRFPELSGSFRKLLAVLVTPIARFIKPLV